MVGESDARIERSFPRGSRLWRAVLTGFLRGAPTALMRQVRRRMSAAPIEEFVIVGRRTGRERRLLLGRARRGAALFGSFLLMACSGAPATSPSPSTLSPTTAPSVVAPAPSPTALPAIVGVWVGVHQCQRIMDLMTAAGMREQGLSNIVDAGTLPGITSVADIKDPTNPCVGAVEVRHSHFFTAAGAFGSRDSIGTQVDDGTWSLKDEDTVLIANEEGATPFDFAIVGTALRLTPLDVGTCPTDPGAWCREAWKLMVAMPGMDWQRAP